MESIEKQADNSAMNITAVVAACVGLVVAGQQPVPTPATFHTSARFGVDAEVLRLQTAVAIGAPHAHFQEFSWVRLYFYAFPLTAEDVATLSTGTIAGLERKRMHPAPGGPDMNHSRAAIHFLLDKNARLSNASLEVPGLTCTIVVEPDTAAAAVQLYEFDGRRLHVKAKGTTVCDLTSVGGAKRAMSWDVDVNVPVFAQGS